MIRIVMGHFLVALFPLRPLLSNLPKMYAEFAEGKVR